MKQSSQKIIALLTDFGSRGLHYVASMKGVILKINPDVSIIDISHDISSFSIIEASYLMKSSYKHFPENTIFIIVVDPGVGSSREILAIKTRSNHYFICPNNGIMLNIINLNEIVECVEVKNSDFFNLPTSSTFHGRDIMAPVAAHISNGVILKDLGPRFNPQDIKEYNIEFNVDQEKKMIKSTVLFIDSFGNVTTNIPIRNNLIKGTSFHIKTSDTLEFEYNNKKFQGILATHFKMEPEGTLLFVIGSSGYLEISKNQASASEEIGCTVGDIVTFLLKF